MPELPEVETVARQLAEAVVRRTVSAVEVFDPKLKGSALERLADRRISSVIRMGKQVVISLGGKGREELHLAVHLRMSGRLVWSTAPLPEHERKHLRARIGLNGGELLFIDPRRFGTMKLSADRSAFSPKGLEPLGDDFTPEALQKLLGRGSQNIKAWMLRQDKLVGIGNIYASEILFRCGISPRRKVSRIKRAEIPALHRAIRQILTKAIENCGTTFSDFQDAHGVTGSYGRFLKVYERENDPCRRCSSPIRRFTQQQRSTYFCQKCQR